MTLRSFITARLHRIETMARWLFAPCLVVVLVFALAPRGSLPQVPLLSLSQLNHILAFTALAGLLATGWPRLSRWMVVVGLMALGGLIEILQGIDVLNRHPSWIDLLVNAIGIMIGLALAIGLKRIKIHFAAD